MNSNSKQPRHYEPQRLPRKKWPGVEIGLLILFSVGAGILAFLSMMNLISPDDALRIFKAVMIGASAALVSFGVNYFAVKKGAELAATGFISAGVASVISILVVGAGLFSSTFAAFTIHEVNELQLQQHGQALVRFAGQRNREAVEAGRIIPVLRANEADLMQHVECEARESCLSGRANGGRGIVTRALEEKAHRASAIARQMQAGEKTLQTSRTRLNRLLGDYQKIVNQADVPQEERRRKLILIDGKIDQAIATMDEALPLALLRAYAKELQEGVFIPGRPVASERINELFGKYAESLMEVFATIEASNPKRPVFPAKAGISSTFPYIGHFLPIAVLTASIELVFPLTLWIYTLLAIVWRKFQTEFQTGIPPRNNPESKGERNRQRHMPGGSTRKRLQATAHKHNRKRLPPPNRQKGA